MHNKKSHPAPELKMEPNAVWEGGEHIQGEVRDVCALLYTVWMGLLSGGFLVCNFSKQSHCSACFPRFKCQSSVLQSFPSPPLGTSSVLPREMKLSFRVVFSAPLHGPWCPHLSWKSLMQSIIKACRGVSPNHSSSHT